MRTALAVFMMLHGVAHLPGFIVPWRIAALKDMPYRTTILSGRLDVGSVGIRIVGTLWLLVAIAFVLAAVGMVTGMEGGITPALCVCIASLLLGLLSLPEARIGVGINLVILVLLAMFGGMI